MHKPHHIVFTSIFQPVVVPELYENLRQWGHLEDTIVWMIGDKKTPEGAYRLCEEYSKRGMTIKALSVDDQHRLAKRWGAFYQRIPYNNETRRNLGYLMALETGAEILISIDDDNFPTQSDFIGAHRFTGEKWSGSLLSDRNGFHNICEYLIIKPERQIYPRGYPFQLRGKPSTPRNIAPNDECRVGVTLGLWLKDPDVDATTWINGKIESVNYVGPERSVLHQETWIPVNTQNTSVLRQLIPAFLCIPMGWDVPGGKIQRYGDIWGGYFLQAIMKGTSFHVAFGHPLVEHRRNPHDYLDDLRAEFWGMMLTDWLLMLLKEEFTPVSSDICDRVDELGAFLSDVAIPQLPAWCPKEVSQFIAATSDTLHSWSNTCRSLL